MVLIFGTVAPQAVAQDNPPPDQAIAAPATSLTVPAYPSYWASDGCRYFQVEDQSWRSDMCMEAVKDPFGNRVPNQVGLRPNVGTGYTGPAQEYLVVWDTSAPEYTTLRFPREPAFRTVQWVRFAPGDTTNPTYQVIDARTGSPRWWSGPELAAALASSAAPAQGPAAGSFAANNPAAITAMTISNAQALGGPALLTASSRPCQMSYNGC